MIRHDMMNSEFKRNSNLKIFNFSDSVLSSTCPTTTAAATTSAAQQWESGTQGAVDSNSGKELYFFCGAQFLKKKSLASTWNNCPAITTRWSKHNPNKPAYFNNSTTASGDYNWRKSDDVSSVTEW
jgi:hypothetical protein